MTSCSVFRTVLRSVLCWILLGALLPNGAKAQRMPQDTWYLAKEFRGQVEPECLDHPGRAAFGPDGNLYVTERSGNRIHVFDATGKSLRTWGSPGNQTGQFNDPVAIAIAPDGTVYVCEWNNHRVQVFDPQGKFLRTFGQHGNAEGQLNGPHGITLDNEGNVYVCENNLARVSVFSSSGTFLCSWGSRGGGEGQFNGVIAICKTADNKIAVLERDGERRIQIFDTKGKFLSRFGSSGWGDGELAAPHGLDTDSAGNFYVIQHQSDRVTVYSPTGTFLRRFGSEGSGDGQFNDSFGVAVANGKVFVCDYNNSRLAVFDTSGNWIKNIGKLGVADFGDTCGIAADADGNVYISSYQQNEIRKFDKAYNFVKRFGVAGSGDGQFNGPRQLAISPTQKLYAVDHEGARIQIFDLDGKFVGKFGGFGSTDGYFNHPWGIAVGGDGRVYVGDRDNHRIQVFDATGRFLFKFGEQGSFYGKFQSPDGVAYLRDGRVVVNDKGNRRLQIFDANGNFLKASTPGWSPHYICAASDGNIYGAWGGHGYYDTLALEPLKQWGASNGAIAELPSGDLICAGFDRVVHVWKRTYRLAQPEPGNAVPLPSILSQGRRPGTSLVDVDYIVKDADDATVQTAALAFKNGGNSLADVIPITSFAEGTGVQLGTGITTGAVHRFTWDVTKDWATDFGEVQLEILAKDKRGLLNLDFLRIPADKGLPELKISRSPLNDTDFLSVWYWLLATGDPGISLLNGSIEPVQRAVTLSYDGSNGQPGLKGTYFSNTEFEGTPSTRIDPFVNIRPANSSQSLDAPFQSEQLSVLWEGVLVPSVTGKHRVFFTTDDGVQVSINGQMVIDSWWDQGATEYSADVDLTRGVSVPIKIEYYDQGDGRAAQLMWQPPGREKDFIPPANMFTGEKSAAGTFAYTPTGVSYAYGTTTTSGGRAYLFNKMGLREATPEEVKRAKEAGNPGVINQWEPKTRRVGPDERPAFINSYGFDTGADGFWVVPVTK